MNFVEQPLFARLLSQSPLSVAELIGLIKTAPARYKEHFIEKRNGRGQRLISQPTAELKYFQRLLVSSELSQLPIHDAAKAYRHGMSIRDHALPHATSKYILKLDFTNFFPSLSAAAIKRLLRDSCDYSEGEEWIICQLLCRRRPGERSLNLSIGSPSSPFISNALMFEFDSALQEYCSAGDVTYTRYADDIALSSSVPGLLNTIHEYVRFLTGRMRYLHLSLNDLKTVNVSKKFKRTLTGLTLSNSGNVSIGRASKRKLRAALHRVSLGEKTTMPLPRLRGMLAFVYSVDKDWVLNLIHQCGFSSIDEVGKNVRE
jgi:RNA-directed DNA polymerase